MILDACVEHWCLHCVLSNKEISELVRQCVKNCFKFLKVFPNWWIYIFEIGMLSIDFKKLKLL